MTADGSAQVVITGIGVVSPIGIGAAPYWAALTQGICGVRPIPGATQTPTVAAQLVDYVARDLIHSPQLRRIDKVSRALVASARLAVDDAQVSPDLLASERAAFVVGTAYGNLGESRQYMQKLSTKGPGLASPMMFPNLVLNAPASYAAMEFGSTGANLTLSQGEISGEIAIAQACDLIRTGRAEVALAGGVDEFDDLLVEGYHGFRALSSQRGGPEWSSPYDAARNGVVLGEGAAVVVLESAKHARARGATAYAEIDSVLQFATSSSTYDWPRHGARVAPRLRAWLSHHPVDIGAVFGAANSSPALDSFELEVLADLFGPAGKSIYLTSIKGAVGEFGAAGALTTASAALALRHQVVPPLCNLQRADAAATLQLPTQSTPCRPEQIMQLGFARGGSCVAILLRQPGELR